MYKPKVLIIDDCHDYLDMMEISLERNGFQAITKNSSDEIGKLVKKHKIDILLLDMKMPDKCGKTFCKELKNNPNTNYFPIIMISGSPDIMQEYSLYQADDAIEKPVDFKVLVDKINVQLGRNVAV
ncbi:MAG TPA: response regulator [Ferruginibacter sp.]|jgi:DNA-binding response OmpR family regulator|nr:response regulator [Ferruginibacter sp.]